MSSCKAGAAAVAAAAVVCVAWLSVVQAASAGALSLPDHRGYELVSEPDKNGSDVLLTTERTRVAVDGNAFGYSALAGFSDTREVAVAADYISERSQASDPGSNGWSTHGIAPVQRALSFGDTLAAREPLYTGPYSPDLTKGVFFAASPVTRDPMVSSVPNLYRRTDLLSPGAGSYELLSACPLCDATGVPLDASGDTISQTRFRPVFAGASPDFNHVVFESPQALTNEVPAQPADCHPRTFPFSFVCGMRLYEWDDGTLRLAGVLPDGSAADASFAGEGASNAIQVPGVISDGSDGHTRTFFTQPTDAAGNTLAQEAGNPGAQVTINRSLDGNLFMRVDHASTDQLNLSEGASDRFAPARFLDASRDGTRAFFMTSQALTSDAPADGQEKIYMYDAAEPGSDPHNLTLVSLDSEPADGTANAEYVVGASDDGHYLYFIANGEMLSGGPLFGNWIYLWHDGVIRRVGAVPTADPSREQAATGFVWSLDPQQSRVSADGRTLLFSSISGEGLTGYDHGTCRSFLGIGCRELYVYSADTGDLACVSCNPSGAPATGMATDFLGDNTIGGTRSDPPNSQAVTADGSLVFFSSPEALVPEDTNGRYDAYEYNVRVGTVSLLTSGTSISDSYFINATPDGRNVFVITRERLVGWDRDDAYDIYDARVDGGFPEPPPPPVPCAGDACHGLPQAAPGAYTAAGSGAFSGAGDEHGVLRRARARSPCRRGHVLRRVRGRRRCVKARARRHAHRSKLARKHGRTS